MSQFDFLDLQTDIKSMVPWHMHNQVEMEIQKSIEKQIIRLNGALIDFVEQLYLQTATWGLIYWERLVGLEPDYTLDTDERRGRIRARLRSSGTTTVEALKAISEAFTNGESEIIEHYEEHYFVIKFISKYGVPTKINELKKAIELIKPAHIDFEFDFKYRTHGDIKRTGKTCRYFKDKRLTCRDLREKEVI